MNAFEIPMKNCVANINSCWKNHDIFAIQSIKMCSSAAKNRKKSQILTHSNIYVYHITNIIFTPSVCVSRAEHASHPANIDANNVMVFSNPFAILLCMFARLLALTTLTRTRIKLVSRSPPYRLRLGAHFCGFAEIIEFVVASHGSFFLCSVWFEFDISSRTRCKKWTDRKTNSEKLRVTGVSNEKQVQHILCMSDTTYRRKSYEMMPYQVCRHCVVSHLIQKWKVENNNARYGYMGTKVVIKWWKCSSSSFIPIKSRLLSLLFVFVVMTDILAGCWHITFSIVIRMQ